MPPVGRRLRSGKNNQMTDNERILMNSRMNWSEVVATEADIALCETCDLWSLSDPGSPQPSWIGADYEPGGTVFVLQNPGVAPDEPVWNQREERLADLLQQFRTRSTVKVYRVLVEEMHAQMQGLDGRGSQKWGRWTHPVRKCVAGCLEPRHFAWMNVVRYRTPSDSPKERDRAPGCDEQSHGLRHLHQELDLLKPRLIVTVGAQARDAVDQLHGDWLPPIYVGQRARTNEAANVANRIRREGNCRGA